MKQTTFRMCIVLIAVGLWGSSALALDSIGAPRSGLGEKEWGLGFDYMFSDMDLGGNLVDRNADEDLRVNKIFGTIGYGPVEPMDVFVGLGLGNAEGDGVTAYGDAIEWGSTELAWRFGTRVTFYKSTNGKWEWGGVLSVSEFESEEHEGHDKVELNEMQIAVGPTRHLSDSVALYGGLFYHNVDGTATEGDDYYEPYTSSLDLHAFGIFVGGLFTINDVASLCAEFQVHDEAVGFGTGFCWRIP